ncbi:MAG TPA: 16S rRNA (cytidine(1402)-2'-O)-methyltransferase [Patescibacteria group bacterium]|nr:16S rRNA (cytidine(1402)-2'-O)-methyltransferase [Patescibacteria group bacterium]
MGTLYVVATPIGNLDDISLRAIRTLFTSDVIACEDTRRAGLLLSELQKKVDTHITQKPRLISFYDQVESEKIEEVIELLESGLSVALISDAGTPTISDPGFKLVRACREKGILVKAVPGPSASVTALSVSGLPTDKFLFLGYPPHKKGHRSEFWENIKKSAESFKTTVILYEAPHKLLGTLTEMEQIFGDKEIVILRELTKIYEEYKKGKISDIKKYFSAKEPKGEFVLLLSSESL